MPSRDELAARLAARQTAAAERLAHSAADRLSTLFTRLDSLDDAALDAWLRLSVPVAQATETAAAQAGVGYVQTLSSLYGHTLADVAPVEEIVGPALRAGTSYVDEWTRPIVTARSAIARGRQWHEALAEGAAKAAQLARTDVGLSSRAGANAAMRATAGCVGYRRVPDSKPCSFCLTISTRRYSVEQLAPAHASCTCGVVPIFDNGDPGAAISSRAQDTLDAVKLDDVSVPVETSEIGPTTAAAAPQPERGAA